MIENKKLWGILRELMTGAKLSHKSNKGIFENIEQEYLDSVYWIGYKDALIDVLEKAKE